MSINAVKDKVLTLTGGKKKAHEAEQIALSVKQVKLVEFLQKESRVTNKQTRVLLKTSNKTAYKLLLGLVKNKVIKKVGGGRTTYYVLR